MGRHGNLDLCEDAVQEALADAAASWPNRGLPDNPRGWLVTVANRRLVDLVRSDASRRRREERILVGSPPAEALQAIDDHRCSDQDDTLLPPPLGRHPALSPPSPVA